MSVLRAALLLLSVAALLASAERFGFTGLLAAKDTPARDVVPLEPGDAESSEALVVARALYNASGAFEEEKVISLRVVPQALAVASGRNVLVRRRVEDPETGLARLVTSEAVVATRVLATLELTAKEAFGGAVSCHVVEVFIDHHSASMPMRHTYFPGACQDAAAETLAETPVRKIEFLSYNIWNYVEPWERRLPSLAEKICNGGYDVIALQEVRYSEWSGETLPSGDGQPPFGRMQIEQIARACKAIGAEQYQFVFEPAMTYAHNIRRGEYEVEGVAVLSRYPIISVARVNLSHDLDDEEDVHQRAVLAASILLPGLTTPLTVFVSHYSLSLPAQKRNAEETLLFAQKQEFEGMQILAGDLNALPESEAIQALVAEGFSDPWVHAAQRQSPTSTGETWNTLDPTPVKRIDYALYRGGLVPSSIVVGPGQCTGEPEDVEKGTPSTRLCASDHFPLSVTFEMPVPTPDVVPQNVKVEV